MFIEEISIDGFKSYAQRVTVPGFDRYFNAITGLNGSGKSNILDSICFVLGITNLSQVSPSEGSMGCRPRLPVAATWLTCGCVSPTQAAAAVSLYGALPCCMCCAARCTSCYS